MNVVFAILCDAANVSQEGKLNMLGSFAKINATVFPARQPEMNLVVRMEASPAEVGMEKKLEVTIMDEDGHKVSGFGADIVVPTQKKSGEPVQMVTIMRIVDTVFPKQGRYAVYVLIDGKTEFTIPLGVGG